MVSERLRHLTSGLVGHLTVSATTAVLVLGLPFVLDPRTYGYWQLYMFYALWLGYLTFGIPDGYHLRHAGSPLEVTAPGRLRGQLGVLTAAVALGCLALGAAGAATMSDPVKAQMWVLACLGTAFFVPRTLLTMALQGASRFGTFARLMVLERGVVVLLTVAVVLALDPSPGRLAGADLAAKALGLVAAAVVMRRMLTGGGAHRAGLVAETRANVTAGTSILLSNLAALAVYGVLRLAVEQRWGVVEFGQVSLAFSVALVAVTLSNAVAMVTFPALKRADPSRHAELYRLSRDGLRGVLAALLVLYFPLVAVLDVALPDYRDALGHLGVIFPLVIFEARVRVLAGGLLKAMRRERVLLVFNLAALSLAVVLSVWFTLVTPSLGGIVASLLVVAVVRGLTMDVWLSRRLGAPYLAGAALDLMVIVGFLAGVTVGGLPGALLYLAVTAAIVVTQRQDALRAYRLLREEVRS